MRECDFPPVTPEELASVGQTLFGAIWRSALAHALGVGESEIVQVEAGKVAAPVEWRGRLIGLSQDVAHRALEVSSALLWRGPRAQLAESVEEDGALRLT